MPFVKNIDPKVFEKCDQEYFDKHLMPGVAVRRTGIYRCYTCGFEVVCRAYVDFLPQEWSCDRHNFGTWPPSGGAVTWWELVALTRDRAVAKS